MRYKLVFGVAQQGGEGSQRIEHFPSKDEAVKAVCAMKPEDRETVLRVESEDGADTVWDTELRKLCGDDEWA